jgi:hypothetical protein
MKYDKNGVIDTTFTENKNRDRDVRITIQLEISLFERAYDHTLINQKAKKKIKIEKEARRKSYQPCLLSL